MKLSNIIRQLCNSKSPYSVTRRLSNFFYWQLIGKRSKDPYCFRLPDGAYMRLRTSEQGASGFYYYGYPDYDEMLFLKHNIKTGDVFVDVGANSGGWSMSAIGMGADVIAFEPIPETFARLNENILLNKNARITAHNVGLSDKEDVLLFTTDADAANRIIIEKGSGSYASIAVKPLDHFLKGIDPAIIKIDVEGHELNVIKGAAETLQNPRLKALIIETFRWANYHHPDFKEMERLLAEKGFYPVLYNVIDKTAILLGASEGGQNTIYLRSAKRNSEN